MDQPEGLIGWIDLATTDVDAAQEFYGPLFGWTFSGMPTPVGVDYVMAYKDGSLVAGMAPLPPAAAAAGAPPAWNSYALVSDVDAVLARVPGAGGQVIMAADDVMDQGRLAMIADPSGAVFGLWQPRAHQGAALFNSPGSLSWNELQTHDLEAATAFYADVLGWQWQRDPSGYMVATIPDKPGEDKSNGGAMTMPPNVPAGVPSFWMVYFAVTDCDAAMSQAVELGGSVLYPAMDMPGMRFGGIVDPQGAVLTVGQFVR